jgi:hypothetical protein
MMKDDDYIHVDGQQFYRVSRVTQGGNVKQEHFFATDGSQVKIEIDYTHTEKGYK